MLTVQIVLRNVPTPRGGRQRSARAALVADLVTCRIVPGLREIRIRSGSWHIVSRRFCIFMRSGEGEEVEAGIAFRLNAIGDVVLPIELGVIGGEGVRPERHAG